MLFICNGLVLFVWGILWFFYHLLAFYIKGRY